METHQARIDLVTTRREETIEITERIREIVRASGIATGICLIATAHTTTALFVNENADADVQRDLLDALSRMVPAEAGYRHAEGNSPAHIKAILIGSEVSLPVAGGEPVLGRWQGVFVAELDGPRARAVTVTVCGDAAPVRARK